MRLDQLPVIRFNFYLERGPELCETSPAKIEDAPVKIARSETDRLGKHDRWCVCIGGLVGITLGLYIFKAKKFLKSGIF